MPHLPMPLRKLPEAFRPNRGIRIILIQRRIGATYDTYRTLCIFALTRRGGGENGIHVLVW